MNKETIEIPLVKATYEKLQQVICELQVERYVKDKEIERLKNELAKIPRAKMEYDLEIERLNNIINELEKWLEENIRITKAHDNQLGANLCNIFLDKLKELKEGK